MKNTWMHTCMHSTMHCTIIHSWIQYRIWPHFNPWALTGQEVQFLLHSSPKPTHPRIASYAPHHITQFTDTVRIGMVFEMEEKLLVSSTSGTVLNAVSNSFRDDFLDFQSSYNSVWVNIIKEPFTELVHESLRVKSSTCTQEGYTYNLIVTKKQTTAPSTPIPSIYLLKD